MDHALLNDVFQWDVRTWSRALPAWQQAIHELRPANALAIGERDGGLSLWLALQDIAVHCTDIGTLPDATAQRHVRYGVHGHITYGVEDATALSARDGRYDLVIFKSVIGALGEKARQSRAINEMHRVLKPGGKLLFAENLAGTRLHSGLRNRFTKWNSYWRYLHWPADSDLFRAFEKVDVHSTGFLATLGRSETQRDVLARIDGMLCSLVPTNWHYMVHGVCTKAR